MILCMKMWFNKYFFPSLRPQLLLFAEGTRFTEDKHKTSLNFAKDKGLPLLKRHLTPRTKGFTSSLPQLRGRVPAIYNIQLCFDP